MINSVAWVPPGMGAVNRRRPGMSMLAGRHGYASAAACLGFCVGHGGFPVGTRCFLTRKQHRQRGYSWLSAA